MSARILKIIPMHLMLLVFSPAIFFQCSQQAPEPIKGSKTQQVDSKADTKKLSPEEVGSDKKSPSTPSPKKTTPEKYKHQLSDQCADCHDEHFDQWKYSLHALAHFEPVYDAYFIKASNETNGETDTFCAKCHTPIGVYNGEIPFKNKLTKIGDTKVTPEANEGLSCDFCHTTTGYTKLENANYIMEPSETKVGPYKDAKSEFHSSKHLPLISESEYCGMCHNVNHPTNGIVLESTYTEWKNSDYAKEGVSCQDCHMTNGLTKKEVHKGEASSTGEGPVRPHVSKHFFVGPNIMFATGEEAKPLRDLSMELIKKAGTIKIGALKKTPDGAALTVAVSNTGAGHYLPTGITEIRELWIELRVKDKNNKEIFTSGIPDADGLLAPTAKVFRTDVADKDGNITTKFWNTVKKVRDHRIPPRKTVQEQFEFPATPLDFPLSISAALQYRSISPAGLKEALVPKGTVTVPILTLATDQKTITKL